MSNLVSTSERKAYRLDSLTDNSKLLSENMYNVLMGGVLCYGIIVNILMCRYFPVDALLSSINPILLFIGYFVLAIGGIMISSKSDSAVISFLGYNLVVFPMGVVICIAVQAYGGMGSDVVWRAFVYTGMITIIMTCLASIFPNFFSKIGGFLFFSLIALIVTGLVGMIFPALSVLYSVYSYAAAVIFSLYIGYDMYRAQIYPKTADNAVDCALDVYVDVVNLFLNLLEILGRDR